MSAAIVALLLISFVHQISAAPRLFLDLAAPSSAVGVDGLVVKATLKNTGDVTLKLLNDPSSILSQVNTNTFTISSASGMPRFTGLKVKYVAYRAARSSGSSAFTVLAPGKTVQIDHVLGGTYNFTRCGEGSYNFRASNIFNYVDESGELKTIKASFNSRQLKIAGRLAVAGRHTGTSTFRRRNLSFTGCSAKQKHQIMEAATASNALVSETNRYLSTMTSIQPRYTTWFGAFDQSNYNAVVSHFQNIGNDATMVNYDCVDCLSRLGDGYPYTMAYANPAVPSTIYICGGFWTAPVTGTDSKAGTIIHENSHFVVNGATDDRVYGQEGSQSLAYYHPESAVANADSHEYFAENTPFLY
ncbi:deuterolysin metalloprotease (M35) family containing protein [Rhizoctonia solani AG-3 Rhs1AP]|uniref:Deuterolysin metalloprotease (M35) family containing protein n=1 Tax=Rhizoctonia solani AG-3 Rhs1AP TaxID=1086054 RepID=A0A0A1UID2_9AGAM|nr:deuterolysin metalloprotease (M35) family containing protein [Rhizoctonia solani AG-3 Rhs1AP]